MLAKFYDYAEFKIELINIEKSDYDELKEKLSKELSSAMKKTNQNSDKTIQLEEQVKVQEQAIISLKK